MKLEDIIKSNDGKWENDIATVRQGAYFVQVARKLSGKIELTEEGLRAFPELAGRVVPPMVPIPEPEESEGSLDDELAALIGEEETPKKRKHGLK